MAIAGGPVVEPFPRSKPATLPATSLVWAGGRFATALFWLSSLAGCAWLLAYIVVRSIQSYPLDAFEEYELFKAVRWTRGASLYGAAGAELLPEAYPPLYFWLLGLLTSWVEPSFVSARILSWSALIVIVASGLWVLSEGEERRVARLAFVTIFLSFHALVGKWFEVAKPDSMLVAFLAVAIIAGEHRSWPQVLTSSLGLWLASLTKQNAPLFLVPLCLAHVVNGRWRWAAAWGTIMGSVIGGSYFLLDWLSQGQFRHWVFTWPAGHGIDVSSGWSRMMRTVAWRGPVLFPILMGSLVFRWNCRWTWCLVAAVGVAALGTAKHGGLENHLYPAAFIAATIAGRWLGVLWARPAAQVSWLPRWTALAILLLVSLPGLPSRRDFRWLARRAQEAREWVEAVRRLDGPVAVGHHLLLAHQAGAECFFSDQILQFPGLVVPTSVRERISGEQFDYLVLGADPLTSPTPGWNDLITAHYSPAGELDCPNHSGVLPRRLYVARRSTANQDRQNP